MACSFARTEQTGPASKEPGNEVEGRAVNWSPVRGRDAARRRRMCRDRIRPAGNSCALRIALDLLPPKFRPAIVPSTGLRQFSRSDQRHAAANLLGHASPGALMHWVSAPDRRSAQPCRLCRRAGVAQARIRRD